MTGPNRYTNLGASNAAVVGSPRVAKRLFSFTCDNENASDRWILFFNQSSTPVNSDVPVDQYKVPAGQQIGRGTDVFTNSGVEFSTALAWAFSSTKDALTLATAGDQSTVIFWA